MSGDETYSQSSHPPTPPAIPQPNSDSPWSIVSSPSTKYYSVAPAPSSDPEVASRQPQSVSATTNAATPVYISEATGNSPASESSSGLASPGSPHSLLFTLSASIQAARAAAQTQREEHGDERGRSGRREEDTLQSRPSSIAALSPVAASIVSATARDQRPEASHTAYTERETSPARAPSSSRVGAKSKQREPGPQKKALSWHCRSCLGVPREPTTTMCGHLFCKRYAFSRRGFHCG